MRFELVDEKHSKYLETKRLYEAAFPPQERGRYELLFKRPKSVSQVLACYDEDLYVGFVMLFIIEDIAHIIYFAIEEDYRDMGYGTQILKQLDIDYKDYRIIADVEKVEDNVMNSEQRIKRMSFYTRNGYKPSGIEYNWKGDNYLILINKGEITDKEFSNFWRTLAKMSNGELREF